MVGVAMRAGLGEDITGAGPGPGAGMGDAKPAGLETGDIVLDRGMDGEGPKAAIAGFGVKLGSGRETFGDGEGDFLSYVTGLLTESMMLGTWGYCARPTATRDWSIWSRGPGSTTPALLK
jgi:hypothetical protein